jgi:hypothetical protein
MTTGAGVSPAALLRKGDPEETSAIATLDESWPEPKSY